jgi:hypothetical protein
MCKTQVGLCHDRLVTDTVYGKMREKFKTVFRGLQMSGTLGMQHYKSICMRVYMRRRIESLIHI